MVACFMNTDKNDNRTLKSNVSYDIIITVAEECSAFACVQSFAVNIYALGTQRAKTNLKKEGHYYGK